MSILAITGGAFDMGHFTILPALIFQTITFNIKGTPSVDKSSTPDDAIFIINMFYILEI